MNQAAGRQALGVAGLAAVALLAALTLPPRVLVNRLAGLTADPVAFVAVLGAVYLVRPFLLWPVTALAVLVGYLYGPVVGLPVALAGTGLSALPPYLLARRVDGGPLASLGGAGRRVADAVGAFRGVVAARLVPIPGDAVSYGAGFAGLPPGRFLAGTVIGEIPWATAAVITGASMRSVSLSPAITPELVVAAAGVAVLVLAGPVYEHVKSPDGR